MAQSAWLRGNFGSSVLFDKVTIGPTDGGETPVGLDAMSVSQLTREECLNAIASVPIGRVGLSSSALPWIIPVNFALVGDSIYFGAMSKSVLAAATERAIVAFQADSYDLVKRSGWTVAGVGPASWVTEPSEIESVDDALPIPWANGHAAEHIVRIDLTHLSGQRVKGL